MYPILFSIGPVTVYNFSVFLILAWLLFSFVFWQKLKNSGVEDDRIFDLTFFSTLAAFILARLAFVVFHSRYFSDNFLKVIAFWVVPGFSFYGAIIGGIAACVYFVRRLKIRLSYVLDALGLALPPALILGSIGSLLDGSVAGKVSGVPWAVRYIGYTGFRHPVQIYTIVGLIFIWSAVLIVERASRLRRWQYGLSGITFFLLFSLSQFMIEFFRDASYNVANLTIQQWVLIGFISEAMGALYIKVGGKYIIQSGLKELYAKFPKRNARKDQG